MAADGLADALTLAPGRHGARVRGLVVLALLPWALAACDTWFGSAEAPPLPGERISVLVHERTLTPDPGAGDTQILLPPPTVNVAWPQSGGYANHAMHHIAMDASPTRRWSTSIGSGSDNDERIVAQPVVADGRLFAMDSASRVAAFDVESGRRLWEAELTPEEEDDDHISGGVAYEDGRVFAATGFAQVVALDAATGDELWRQTVTSPMRAAPSVRNGRAIVVTIDNHVSALSADTGEPLWTYSGPDGSSSLLGGASPAIDDGVVVVPFNTGELAALVEGTGQLLWSDSLAPPRRTEVLSSVSAIHGNPVIDRGRVLAASYGGLIAAIDLRSGRRLWDKDVGGLNSPWVAGSYVFLLTNDNELICIGRNSGRIHWVASLPRFEDEEDRTDPIVWAGPVLASDRLIVAGTSGEALAVSPYSGQILGRVELQDPVSIPPVIAGGTVYFLTDDADIVAYR